MKKELLQQVLDALENSSDLVFKDLSKSYLRELAVNTLREAIAQPEQPAAPVAPIPALPTPWHHRILKVHPKSEPEFWPDELRIKYMADEISELRAAVTLQFTPPVVQAEPVLYQERSDLRGPYSSVQGWTDWRECSKAQHDMINSDRAFYAKAEARALGVLASAHHSKDADSPDAGQAEGGAA